MINKLNLLKGLLCIFLFVCSGAAKVEAQTPDPGLMGPHTVLKAEYNLGDLSYSPPPAAMFPANMEERGSVHYPADLSSGPFPVILFLHGRHETCYDPSALTSSSDWPCAPGDSPILSYAGYDYLARTMASHGYIVISISANSINAIDGGLSDDGMNARGVLVQHHLDLWNTWNTTSTGPFGSTFVGKLNMKNIGTMGHSRGGEGVVFNAEYNRTLGSPYGIKAVLTLAPVDFYRHVLNGIPLMDVAPYCDGDVSDLEGVHFYDDARYADPTDEAPKHTVLFMGANHDFFNTSWTPGSYVAGGADDWADYGYNPFDPHCGTMVASRFDTTKQKAALNAYLPAFFRLYIGKELQFAPILEVKDIVPPASSTLGSSDVFVSYHPGHSDRLDVNKTENASRTTTNNLGGAVTETGLVSSAICGGTPFPNCDAGLGADQTPHKGMGQMRLRWNDTTDWYENAIPAANQNTTLYQNLFFRVTVDFKETTPVPSLDFTVALIDSAGDTSSQVVGSLSHTLFYQTGTEPGTLPKEVFNTVNVPLSGFSGIDMTRIRYIRFKFNKSTAGAIIISDLAFANPLCGNLQAMYTDSVIHTGPYKVLFTNKSMFTGAAASDTTSILWNFGEPSSGVNDTSTLQNPNHIYSAAGSYHVCVTLRSNRKNGFFCTDTFCTTVVVMPREDVPVVSENQITIVPNPAKDYLQITGAANTDVLTLINLYGQVVFTATVTQPTIQLPQNLATGVYYAIVTTDNGRVYKKIMIAR